ncbi:MAG: flagellar basal-body MS-ring/collar protein FliF [Bacillota bacterium]
MAGFFKDSIAKIAKYFQEMEKGKRLRLIILVVVAFAVILAASILLNQKTYTVLYSGMNAEDAGEVLARLNEMSVDAKAQGSDTILVESGDADSIRMQLAAEGYPSSGYNYDIFQNASGLGTTDMEKRVYLQFQLQENLRKTIVQLDKVKDAVVNVTLGESSSFVLSDDEKPATAAVMLKLEDGAALGDSEVRAIAELVSKSVPGLDVDEVRVIDSEMNLYDINDDTTVENVGTQMQLQQTVQEQLQTQVTNLLAPIFGKDSVLAQVNVVLNFDRQTSESVVFKPPVEGSNEGLAVSMQELAETVQGDASGGSAGVDANGGTTTYPTVTGEDSPYSKISKETNYELNETRTQIENAQGKIQDLSVSVIIDSSTTTEDYTERVKNLVATAIGVSDERITVDMLPFKQMDQEQPGDTATDAFTAQQQTFSEMQKASIIRLGIIIGAAVIVLILALIAILTLRKKKPVETVGGYGVDYYADDTMILEPGGAALEPAPESPKPSQIKEIPTENQENGNLTRLEQYIENSPESVAQLLRNWLSDD